MKKLMGDEGWGGGGGALFFSTDPKCLCFRPRYAIVTVKPDVCRYCVNIGYS